MTILSSNCLELELSRAHAQPNEMNKSDAEYEVVLIDATETPIERPKKTKILLFRKKEVTYPKSADYCRQEKEGNNWYSLL